MPEIELPQHGDKPWSTKLNAAINLMNNAIDDLEENGVGGAGSPGLSAYEVAVANGFVGDQAAWLASLVGTPGSAAPSPYVEVLTGNEARPDLPLVIWVGGTEAPANIAINDLWYAEAEETPPVEGDTTAPSVPASVTISEQTETSFRVTWNASTDDTAVTGYEVQVDGTPTTTSATTLVVTGRTAETTYSVRVRARDAVPNWSALSTAVTAVTTAAAGGGGTTEHTIFAATTPPTFTSYNDGGTLRVANGFYSYGATAVERVVGMRIFKAGTFSTSGTAYLWFADPTVVPNLQSPLQSKAYSGLVDGWNEIRFDTPITLPTAKGVWVGYQSSDGSYMHAPSPGAGFIAASDGTLLVMLENAGTELDGTVVERSYFSMNGGANGNGTGVIYGIDIITDEGAV